MKNNLENVVKGIKRFAGATVLAAGLSLAAIGCTGAGVGPSKPSAPDYSTEIATITKAADRLVATQNNDGGWEWENPDLNPATPNADTYGLQSAGNTFGVTALGLLDAYKVTGKQEYLTAAEKTATWLVNLPTTVDATSQSDSRGHYAQDILFLSKLGKITGDASYTTVAQNIMNFFVNKPNRYTSEGFATAGATGVDSAYKAFFPDSSGNQGETEWALSAWYWAGKSLGADVSSLATQMAKDMPGYFDPNNPTNQNVYILGLAGELSTTGSKTIESKLVSLQQPDGTWSEPGPGIPSSGIYLNGKVQDTAYAVMALVNAGDMTDAYKGVQAGMKHQASNGGWIESDGNEYTEVDSEVVQAISDYIINNP